MFVAAGEEEMYEISLKKAHTLRPRVVRVNASLALTIPRGTDEEKQGQSLRAVEVEH